MPDVDVFLELVERHRRSMYYVALRLTGNEHGGRAGPGTVAEPAWPSVRLRSAHRLSALLLGVFIIGHIVNQSLAFLSVASYAAMRGAMRVATQQSISYTVIVTMVAMQMMTGVAMGLKRGPRRSTREKCAGSLRLVSCRVSADARL